MKKLLSVLVVQLFVLTSVLAQIPQVPEKMTFAGIELTIEKDAREEIQKSVDKLHANPSYFNRMVETADLYFPVIEGEFAKTNFPNEIKYLCIQESAFKSEAVSTSNAVGFWQFKEATAIEQGMLVNHHIDERKNIVSSSCAAAKYITAHNYALNNWVYSVIAFNTGLGGVRQFYDTKYAGVDKMTIDKNTHWYFLKYLAHVVAFQDFVGKRTPQIKLLVYTQTAGKSVEDFATEHGLAVSDVSSYNLWIKENRKIDEGKEIAVVVPVPYSLPPPEQKETVIVENHHGKEEKHTVKQPKKHVEKKKTESEPVQAETIITKKTDPSKPEVAVEIKKESQENYRYTVNKIPAITAIEGDNSSTLALKAGIDREKFLQYNEIKNFEDLVPGQTYFLKKKKSSSNMMYHTTQYGETMWMISQKYGVRENVLRRKNRMSDHETTQPGRVIFLKHLRQEEVPIEYKEVEKPKPVVQAPKVEEKKKTEESRIVDLKPVTIDTTSKIVDEKPAKFTHWVQPQETLEMIAHLYQVDATEITKWNNLSSDNLVAGTKLKIYESQLKVKIVKDSTLGIPMDDLYQYEIKKEVAPKVAPNAIENKVIENKTDPNLVVKQATQFKSIIVEPGTTLYGLAREYGVTVGDIKKYNPTITDALSAGSTIQIPVFEKVVATSKTYTVLAGDTYYSVSKKLGVTVEYIKVKNNKTDNALKVGEVLEY